MTMYSEISQRVGLGYFKVVFFYVNHDHFVKAKMLECIFFIACLHHIFITFFFVHVKIKTNYNQALL